MNKVCKRNNLCLFSSLYTENLKYTQTRTYKLMLFLSSECCMSCHALCFWMNVCRAAVALHALAGWVAVLCSGRSFLDLLWLRFTWPLPQLPLLPDHMTTWLPIQRSGLRQCSTFSHELFHDLCALGSAVSFVVIVASLYWSKKNSYIMDYDCVSWHHLFWWYRFVVFVWVRTCRKGIFTYLKTLGFLTEYFIFH